MRAQRMFRAALAVGIGLRPLSAAADQASSAPLGQAPSEEVVRDLRAHAAAAFNEGAYKEASDFYRAALKLKATRESACNLGVAARLSGNVVEAAQALTACLAEPLPRPTAEEEQPRIARYRADLEVVRHQVGTLVIQAPEGADVAIDQEPIGRAPLAAEVFVAPGAHIVTVHHQGRATRRSIFVGAGKRVAVAPAPAAKPAPQHAAPAPGRSAQSRSVLLVGQVATGITLGLGLAALGASRVVGAGAGRHLEQSRNENPAGCAVPHPGAECGAAAAKWQMAGVLTAIGIGGVVTAAVFGGGTAIYAVVTSPGPSAKSAGFTMGWRGTW